MPYKRRYVKKRMFRRKRNSKRTFGKAPMPASFATSMKYSTTLQLDPGVGGLATVHVFSANGLFDPDVSGTGHQPRGFDQLMALYDRATVVGSKIQIKASNNDATNPQMLGIALLDTATVLGDENGYLESKYNVYRLLGTRDGDSTGSLIKGFGTKRFFGVNTTSPEELDSTTSSNPLKQAFFHVWVAPTASVDTTTVSVVVTIDYALVLKGYINPTQS